MKIKVNYRGNHINNKLKGNITRSLKKAFEDGVLKVDENVKTNIYVKNTSYSKYTVEAFTYDTTPEAISDEDTIYEIVVIYLKRDKTENSTGQIIEELELVK